MKQIKLFALALFGAAIFTGCSNDDDNNCTLNTSSLAGTYKMMSVMYQPTPTSPAVEIINNTEHFDACEIDDQFIFTTNTVTNVDAGTQCSANPTPDVNNYTLSGNVINVNGETRVIENFNCNSFVAVGNSYDVPGDVVKITFTRQ